MVLIVLAEKRDERICSRGQVSFLEANRDSKAACPGEAPWHGAGGRGAVLSYHWLLCLDQFLEGALSGPSWGLPPASSTGPSPESQVWPRIVMSTWKMARLLRPCPLWGRQACCLAITKISAIRWKMAPLCIPNSCCMSAGSRRAFWGTPARSTPQTLKLPYPGPSPWGHTACEGRKKGISSSCRRCTYWHGVWSMIPWNFCF